ncbi:MAG: hypothetical protein NC355_08160 [Blautia sp.]|nr:hypothetical protein [Blautia sp.]MCM1283274.1 hypothetical protein [Roseburia sp.]MCM1429932.1 hypothetical protein [Muribaculaceae bacterium]MCM1493041.1 hypothetical protein [Muribaculaceae bacterium]
MNTKIGTKLKEYRKNHGWTIENVSEELCQRFELDIAGKTIYGWESDQSLPRTQSFLALCELYQIERLYEEFPVTKRQKPFSITPEERTLLYKLRKHPELRDVINRILDV